MAAAGEKIPPPDLLSRPGVQGYCFRAPAGRDELTRALTDAGAANLELYRVHFDAAAGTGTLDLPGLPGWPGETGYQGPLTLEYEDTGDQPVPIIRSCLAAVRRAMP